MNNRKWDIQIKKMTPEAAAKFAKEHKNLRVSDTAPVESLHKDTGKRPKVEWGKDTRTLGEKLIGSKLKKQKKK